MLWCSMPLVPYSMTCMAEKDHAVLNKALEKLAMALLLQ